MAKTEGTHDEVPKRTPSTNANTTAEPVDATTTSGHACVLDHADLALGRIVLAATLAHLPAVRLGKHWSQTAVVLDASREDRRARTRVGVGVGVAAMVVRVRRVWVLWSLGDDDLVVDSVVDHLELVCVWFIGVSEGGVGGVWDECWAGGVCGLWLW